jgi:hypothetical protein
MWAEEQARFKTLTAKAGTVLEGFCAVENCHGGRSHES